MDKNEWKRKWEFARLLQGDNPYPSPTLAEIFADLRREAIKISKEEGLREGRKEALQRVSWNLFRTGHSDEAVVHLTELEWSEVKEMRKRFQAQ